MKSSIKDFFNSFSASHETPEEEMLPDFLENSVMEPKNPADVSDIFTTHYSPSAEYKADKSIILRDMVVHGSIETKSDIEVYGTIHGDIISEGRVKIIGFTSGNISGKTVDIASKELNANVNATDKVTIDKDTVINGNVSAGTATINGTINGNIKATNELIIMACATITGDLEAPTLEVNRGAVINGKVSFTSKQ